MNKLYVSVYPLPQGSPTYSCRSSQGTELSSPNCYYRNKFKPSSLIIFFFFLIHKKYYIKKKEISFGGKRRGYSYLALSVKIKGNRDFPGSPVVKTSPSNAGGESSTPGLGPKSTHAFCQKRTEHKREAEL